MAIRAARAIHRVLEIPAFQWKIAEEIQAANSNSAI